MDHPSLISKRSGTSLFTLTVCAALGSQPGYATATEADSPSGLEDAGQPVDRVVTVIPEDQRHQSHSGKPQVPQPQRPVMSTEKNVDTGREPHEWQHLTDDWGGARPWLDDHGFVIESSLTFDWSSNWHGGANTNGSSFRHLFLFDITIDTERLFGLPGGTVFMDFMNQNGEDGSQDTGDFQAYSNIDADGRTQIAELWYEHVFLDGKLRVKVGKVEANAEFAYTDNGGEFLNSSMGFSPTIFVLPTYPDPSMAIVVFAYPTDNLYAGVGIFDGAAVEDFMTGTRGPSTFFESSPADMFVIGEAGITWQWGEGLAGRLAAGGWGHNGSFERFDGTGNESGTAGFYFLADQTLWREDPSDEDNEQGIGVFLQFGWADGDVSEAELHFGCGVNWIGPIPTRDDDAAGVGITWVKFTDDDGAGFTDDSETAIEVFYKLQVMQWASVKPDIQYILTPGGADLNDALVGTLRVEFVF